MRLLFVFFLLLSSVQTSGADAITSMDNSDNCLISIIRKDVTGFKDAVSDNEIREEKILLAPGDEMAVLIEPGVDLYAYIFFFNSDENRAVMRPGLYKVLENCKNDYHIPAGYRWTSPMYTIKKSVPYEYLTIILCRSPATELEKQLDSESIKTMFYNKLLQSTMAVPNPIAGATRNEEWEKTSIRIEHTYEKTFKLIID